MGVLTLGADDLGSLPGAVREAAHRRDMSLEEAVGTLVTHHRVYIVVRPPPTHKIRVSHSRGGAAHH